MLKIVRGPLDDDLGTSSCTPDAATLEDPYERARRVF